MKSGGSVGKGFISTKPEPCNWLSACKKYLESVHKPANDSVMTTVPADPENPVSHSIIRQ